MDKSFFLAFIFGFFKQNNTSDVVKMLRMVSYLELFSYPSKPVLIL